MTKEEYEDFVLRYQDCGACFPLYLNLNYFEKKWFSAIRKDVAELEAQIEKMKCCNNCKHSRTEYEHCRTDKHEKWEMKEK